MVPDSCLSVVMVSGTGLVIVRSEKFVLKALTPPFLSLDSGSHFFLLHPPHFYFSIQLFCIIFLLVIPVFWNFVIEGTSLKIPFPGSLGQLPLCACSAKPRQHRRKKERKSVMESLRKCHLDYRCVARFIWYRYLRTDCTSSHITFHPCHIAYTI